MGRWESFLSLAFHFQRPFRMAIAVPALPLATVQQQSGTDRQFYLHNHDRLGHSLLSLSLFLSLYINVNQRRDNGIQLA